MLLDRIMFYNSVIIKVTIHCNVGNDKHVSTICLEKVESVFPIQINNNTHVIKIAIVLPHKHC